MKIFCKLLVYLRGCNEIGLRRRNIEGGVGGDKRDREK